MAILEILWNCWHFWPIRTWKHCNHSDLTIKIDIGQHSQSLQCFLWLLRLYLFWYVFTHAPPCKIVLLCLLYETTVYFHITLLSPRTWFYKWHLADTPVQMIPLMSLGHCPMGKKSIQNKCCYFGGWYSVVHYSVLTSAKKIPPPPEATLLMGVKSSLRNLWLFALTLLTMSPPQKENIRWRKMLHYASHLRFDFSASSVEASIASWLLISMAPVKNNVTPNVSARLTNAPHVCVCLHIYTTLRLISPSRVTQCQLIWLPNELVASAWAWRGDSSQLKLFCRGEWSSLHY